MGQILDENYPTSRVRSQRKSTVKASKAKGMWMGGNVPFGYRVEDRIVGASRTLSFSCSNAVPSGLEI